MNRPSAAQRRYQRSFASPAPRIHVVRNAETIGDRRRARLARMEAILDRQAQS